MKYIRWIIVISLVFVGVNGYFTDGVAQEKTASRKEASYYQAVSDPENGVWCQLCPRKCVIPDGELGFCRSRKNKAGKLYALGYNLPCSIHPDPIEKKPFFHFLPKTQAFSIASAGCNLRCHFCQNWQISQASPLETENYFFTSEKVVAMALKNNCSSIAYTYTEPTNFYEYMLETARIARQKGVFNVYHSNGYINPAPLKELCRYLDAANIDLKGFSTKFYQEVCEGELEPVLETLKTLKKEGVWLEITNLVIPGYNDDSRMLKAMCGWINENLGSDVPLHFSRFSPMYKMTGIAPTPVATLEKARDIAMKAGLRYVYIGNIPGHPGENTWCPKCKKAVVVRVGYSVINNYVKDGKCEFCGQKIPGVWTP